MEKECFQGIFICEESCLEIVLKREFDQSYGSKGFQSKILGSEYLLGFKFRKIEITSNNEALVSQKAFIVSWKFAPSV